MKKRIFRNRRSRYAAISATLTVLVIAAVILANSVFGSLAGRYEWYSYMTAEANYDVTSVCYSLLDKKLSESDPDKRTGDVRILFCDTEEAWKADSTQSYLYHTAKSIGDRYEGVSVEFHNIKLNPDSVRPYTKDPETGETVIFESSGVVIVCDDYYRFYALEEFFAFSDRASGAVWGYSGERTLAAGILRALNRNPQTACLTSNHGEIFYDYELIYLLDAAGYKLNTSFDLAVDDIPDDCTLIISSNPNSDLDFTDGINEDKKLDAFLEKDGHSLIVLLANGTPKLSNYESYLQSWGVRTLYFNDPASGRAYRYTVQDTGNSLTSDGYTITGELSGDAFAQKEFAGLNESVIFKNATALTNATDFVASRDGTYVKGNRTLHAIYQTAETASLWANGVARSGDNAMLMTLTEQRNQTGGCSYVGVISSVEFAEQGMLQTAVYSNPDTLQRLFRVMGQDYTTEGLRLKPFASTDISTITTAQMFRWTACLAVIPACAIAAIAVFVLVRRRRA